jgi:hypothetical protein
MWSVRRDPDRPETEVAAFRRDYDLCQYMATSFSRDKTCRDLLFVMRRRDRSGRRYTVHTTYIGRPPPLVIDHEPFTAPGLLPPRAVPNE